MENKIFGKELVEKLESEIATLKCENTDAADYHIAVQIAVAEARINLLKKGCVAWFTELMTLEGDLCQSRWCDTRFGTRLEVKKPDGQVIWTIAETKRGLEKRGLKSVQVKRVAWISDTGHEVPCDFNYWTGEEVKGDNILEIKTESDAGNF